ncbi:MULTISPECIES: NAD(P)/FAD-dependent oxidoreductase [Halorussus]|uniref:NAD(P)/FAD-dependent oxidoreductase n=1 Tax=Halorussus TaxID=1070314 RepID=UPI000E214A99|nr:MULTISPECIES: NAD(P)/FAD-dependent oxidoreductase [Halorussus]NHN61356.1 NAD(P)/FAD-dependent oxidoreductase [Halorussus sp. JP-T4]
MSSADTDTESDADADPRETTAPDADRDWDADHDCEYDVAVVGGGPAGCSAGVFTARYGLDTVVFDRGRSSIQRCAFLENYLGFPAGIDVETFYELLHDHVEETGCDLVADMVESVSRADGDGFVVATQEDRRVTARRVIAATRYGGEYLRGLDDEDAMFETHSHGGEEHEHFDREYAERDGRTPVEDLYVASPSAEADRQAVVAAGRGARVALTVLADVRRDRGYPDAFADHYDWLRREAELDGEWGDRDRWREWFADRKPDGLDVSEDRLVELREREIDRRFDTYLADDEIERRVARGQRRLLDHVDDEYILEAAREIEAETEPGSAETRD